MHVRAAHFKIIIIIFYFVVRLKICMHLLHKMFFMTTVYVVQTISKFIGFISMHILVNENIQWGTGHRISVYAVNCFEFPPHCKSLKLTTILNYFFTCMFTNVWKNCSKKTIKIQWPLRDDVALLWCDILPIMHSEE